MKMRRKILTAVAIVFALAILIPVIHHYQLRFAVEKYIAGLKAQGEPMDLAQVVPPPVSSKENGVPLIAGSLTNLDGRYKSITGTNMPAAMQQIAWGKAMIGWQQPAIVGFNINAWPLTNNLVTNTWEDLGQELADAKDDLNNFRHLTNYPALDFNLDYHQGFDLPLRHLAPLKRSAQWLSAAASYKLHKGETESALADIQTILAIVKGQSDERLEISQLVRIAIAQIGVAATWEFLQHPDISESDLEFLQRDWQSLQFIQPIERAYLMERVMDVSSMEQYRRQPDKLWNSVSGSDGIGRLWRKNQWRWFWSYADEKRALQTQGVLLDAIRMAETNKSFQAVQSFVSSNFVQLRFEVPESKSEDSFRIDIDEFEMRWLFSEGAYDSFSVVRKVMRMETAKSMVVTAIALKRFELQHHQYPQELAELVPTFLTSVPTDYMDGHSLRYKLNSDGTFLLYSVGENGVDDGGNPAPEKNITSSSFQWQNPKALDWVWPQPATEVEVQNYYAHPPK